MKLKDFHTIYMLKKGSLKLYSQAFLNLFSFLSRYYKNEPTKLFTVDCVFQ